MSRLKREGNPPVGQLASPVPQAWDPNLGDFREITGQNLGGGRFGTDGVQWGKTASGLFVPVKVTNEGVQEVQVSGTDYEVITLANAVAITTDQLLRYRGEGTFTPGDMSNGVSIEGWNKYNFHAFDIVNTHDVEVTLDFLVTRLIGAGWASIGDGIKIAAGSVYRVIHIPYTSQAIFEGKLSSNISASLKCSTAPTTGSIVIKLMMWN